MEIVLNIIKLYKSDPMLALAVSLNLFNILINFLNLSYIYLKRNLQYCDPNQYTEEIRQVICGMSSCVNDNNNI